MTPFSGFVWWACHCHLRPDLFQVPGRCQELPCTGVERHSWWYKYLYIGCFSIFGALLTTSHSPEFTQSKSWAPCWVREARGGFWVLLPTAYHHQQRLPTALAPAPSQRLAFLATIFLSLCRSFIISSHGVQASLVIQPFLQCFRNNHLEKNARFPSLESPWVMNLFQFGWLGCLAQAYFHIYFNKQCRVGTRKHMLGVRTRCVSAPKCYSSWGRYRRNANKSALHF